MAEAVEEKYEAVDVKEEPAVTQDLHEEHLGVPDQFLCPITHEVMDEPVILLGDGQTYEKHALEEWLSSNELSPATGEELKSKEFAPNWTLRRIVQDWRRNKAGAELRAEQKQRLEAYLQPDGPYAELCDIELFIGEEEVLFRAVRGMVASLSPHLRTILGDPEKTSFIIHGLSPTAFSQILRLAYNLDPEVDSENVLPLLKAANLLHLDMLKDECLSFMADNLSIPKVAKQMMLALEPSSDYGVDDKTRDQFMQMLLGRDLDATSAMTVFNSAWTLEVLTAELETKVCKIFTDNAEAVVLAPSFLFTRLEMMKELIECDIFCVKEDVLWSRVCEWAKKQYELEVSNADRPIQHEDAPKKKNDDDFGGKLGMDILSDNLKEQVASMDTTTKFPDGALKYLRQIIPLFRFPLMEPAFFAKEVASLLSREEVVNVLSYMVNPATESIFNTKVRAGGSSGESEPFVVVSAHPDIDKARTLGDLNVESKWSGTAMSESGKQWFVTDCLSAIRIKKFDWKNYYEDDDTIHNIQLFMLPPEQLDGEFSDQLAAGEDKWELVQAIEIQKTTAWQTHDVNMPSGKTAQYFKWVVLDVYGSESRYTCLNHLKLHFEFTWRTNFSGKQA